METVDVIVAVCAVLGALLGGGGILGIAVTWGRVRQKIETIEERNRRLTQMYDEFFELHQRCLHEQRECWERVLNNIAGLDKKIEIQHHDFQRFLQWAFKNGKRDVDGEEE